MILFPYLPLASVPLARQEFDSLWKLAEAVPIDSVAAKAIQCAYGVVDRYAVEAGSRVRDCAFNMVEKEA